MCKEIGAHDTNGTFGSVQLPRGRRLIGAKWVFVLKAGGLHKARLVVLANFQTID